MITKERFQELLFYVANNHQDLTALNLSFEMFSNEGVNALAGVLGNNQTIQALDLSSVNMTYIGAMNLANAVSNNQGLLYLGAACNEIGDAGAQAFFNGLRDNQALQSLSLMQNGLTDACVPNLVTCLQQNHRLKSINLDNNHLSNEGLVHIAGALSANFTLTQLHFRNNSGITKESNFVIAEIKHYLKRNKKIARIQEDIENSLSYVQSLDQKMLEQKSNFNASLFEKNYFTILTDIENQIVNGITELQDIGYPGAEHLMDHWHIFCATGYPKLNAITQAQLLEEIAKHQDSPFRLDALRLLGQLYYHKMRGGSEEGELQRLLKSHVYFKHAANSQAVSEGILRKILNEVVQESEDVDLSPHKRFFNPENHRKIKQIEKLIKQEEDKLRLNDTGQAPRSTKRMTFLFDQRKRDMENTPIPMETNPIPLNIHMENTDVEMEDAKKPITRLFSME